MRSIQGRIQPTELHFRSAVDTNQLLPHENRRTKKLIAETLEVLQEAKILNQQLRSSARLSQAKAPPKAAVLQQEKFQKTKKRTKKSTNQKLLETDLELRRAKEKIRAMEQARSSSLRCNACLYKHSSSKICASHNSQVQRAKKTIGTQINIPESQVATTMNLDNLQSNITKASNPQNLMPISQRGPDRRKSVLLTTVESMIHRDDLDLPATNTKQISQQQVPQVWIERSTIPDDIRGKIADPEQSEGDQMTEFLASVSASKKTTIKPTSAKAKPKLNKQSTRSSSSASHRSTSSCSDRGKVGKQEQRAASIDKATQSERWENKIYAGHDYFQSKCNSTQSKRSVRAKSVTFAQMQDEKAGQQTHQTEQVRKIDGAMMYVQPTRRSSVLWGTQAYDSFLKAQVHMALVAPVGFPDYFYPAASECQGLPDMYQFQTTTSQNIPTAFQIVVQALNQLETPLERNLFYASVCFVLQNKQLFFASSQPRLHQAAITKVTYQLPCTQAQNPEFCFAKLYGKGNVLHPLCTVAIAYKIDNPRQAAPWPRTQRVSKLFWTDIEIEPAQKDFLQLLRNTLERTELTVLAQETKAIKQ